MAMQTNKNQGLLRSVCKPFPTITITITKYNTNNENKSNQGLLRSAGKPCPTITTTITKYKNNNNNANK